jgi:two-component system, NtrC family, sensor histidine kinase HydH
MFGAMNVIRAELNGMIDSHYLQRPEELIEPRTALGKILDLELAIMLHTYREDLLSQQARIERLSTFGQLVGSIGHELRNPLGVIESSLFILKGRVGSDPRAEKHIQRISEQLTVANDIVTKLLDMIRDRPLSRTNVKLPDVVNAAASSVHWPAHVKLLQNGLEGLPEIPADAAQLRQVFLNLLENAVQAMGAHGEIRVHGVVDGSSVEVTVEDTGPGVDVSIRNRLFEPLVTTKTKGIGLGLALVKRIVERHGGFISYRPGGDGGARFAVRLPIANP